MSTPLPPGTTALAIPFAIDPGTRSAAERSTLDAHAVDLIREVLLTAPGERVNRPDFGCGLRAMLFTPLNTATAALVQVMVVQAIERWLRPLVAVERVEVAARDAALTVRLHYRLRTEPGRRTLDVEVTP